MIDNQMDTELADTFGGLIELHPNDEYNAELVRNTHPVEWRNPEPASRYNFVVIGAGTAGLVACNGPILLKVFVVSYNSVPPPDLLSSISQILILVGESHRRSANTALKESLVLLPTYT